MPGNNFSISPGGEPLVVHTPDEIRFSIRSRRRSREVRLPVLGPGNARGRIVEPLRVCRGQGGGPRTATAASRRDIESSR